MENENYKIYELWHGSNGGINFPIRVDYSKSLTDFGKGFYLGENMAQAINRVCERENSIVYKFKLKIDKECKMYKFADDILWAMYIAYNRDKKIEYSRYPKLVKIINEINNSDIIIGNIANDKIAFSYNNFIDRLTTSKVLIESLKQIKYGKQFVIKTNKYVSEEFLQIEQTIKLSEEDREKSREWGKSIKEKMDNEIEEIQNKYRREGRFIDEILEDYR